MRDQLKRKAEETVIESVKAQLPIVGPQGTILDYEQTLSSNKTLKTIQPPKVKVKHTESASSPYAVKPKPKPLVDYPSSDEDN